MRASALVPIAGLLAAVLGAGRAAAAGVQVSPVLVELTRRQSNALVALRNEGGEPVRYQVSVSAWDQDSTGQMKLTPSRDLIVFPALLTLQPGEQRNLRVGALPDRFGAVEKAYRLFVEELPPAEKPGAKPAVQVLTRIGVPVFVEPDTRVGSPRIEDAALASGALSFKLRDAGNVRIRPSEVVAVARGPSAEPIAQQRWEGWYVLAGQEREFRWSVPPEACKQVRSLTIEARMDGGAVQGAVQTPAGACRP